MLREIETIQKLFQQDDRLGVYPTYCRSDHCGHLCAYTSSSIFTGSMHGSMHGRNCPVLYVLPRAVREINMLLLSRPIDTLREMESIQKLFQQDDRLVAHSNDCSNICRDHTVRQPATGVMHSGMRTVLSVLADSLATLPFAPPSSVFTGLRITTTLFSYSVLLSACGDRADN